MVRIWGLQILKMATDIEKGREIRDKVFKGNTYAQLSEMRKTLWAICVHQDLITFETEEETIQMKTKAQEIIDQGKQLNSLIEEVLNNE